MTTGKDSPVLGPPYSVSIYRMLQAFYDSGLLREYLKPVGRVLQLWVETCSPSGMCSDTTCSIIAECLQLILKRVVHSRTFVDRE